MYMYNRPSELQHCSTVVQYKERADTNHEQPELELELIQTQMTQKPMLRAEVYARALLV